MTLFNPWSLELLLHASHQGDAISGNIKAKDAAYEVELRTRRRATEKDFTYLDGTITKTCRNEDIVSAEQVFGLVSLYGGNEYFRMMLNNTHNHLPYIFFDISVDQGKIRCDKNFRTLRFPAGEFSPKRLLKDICKSLNLAFEETEDRIYLLSKQDQATFTPEIINTVYQRMKDSDYFPSISCSSARKGFSVYQFPALEGVHQTLSMFIGRSFSKEKSLRTDEIALLERTLLHYCPALPHLNYTWRTETAKDLKGWEGAPIGP